MVKMKLTYILCCCALVVSGLARPASAQDGCGWDKRTAMPSCAEWTSKKKGGERKITVTNNCSYKIQVKVDMAPTWNCLGGFDGSITVEAGHTNSSSWICGSLSGVYCCKSWWDSGPCPDEP